MPRGSHKARGGAGTGLGPLLAGCTALLFLAVQVQLFWALLRLPGSRQAAEVAPQGTLDVGTEPEVDFDDEYLAIVENLCADATFETLDDQPASEAEAAQRYLADLLDAKTWTSRAI